MGLRRPGQGHAHNAARAACATPYRCPRSSSAAPAAHSGRALACPTVVGRGEVSAADGTRFEKKMEKLRWSTRASKRTDASPGAVPIRLRLGKINHGVSASPAHTTARKQRGPENAAPEVLLFGRHGRGRLAHEHRQGAL